MNRKVLLGLVIVLTLITAGIHLTLGSGMLFGRPQGGRANRPPQNGTPQLGGTPGAGDQLAGGGGTGQGAGGGNGQGNAGGNRPSGGSRPGGGPLSFLFRYLGPLFLANVIGYLALLAIVVFPAPYFKDHVALAHWLLIAFAAVTIVAYFGVTGFGGILRNTAALVAKTDELLLIVLTFLHLRAVQSSSAAAATPAAAS